MAPQLTEESALGALHQRGMDPRRAAREESHIHVSYPRPRARSNALAGTGTGSYIPAVPRRDDSAPPPSVLAVRFGAMGDLILATPLFRAIRRRHPDATLTVVTKSRWTSLLDANPHVTEVIGWDEEMSLRTLAARLRPGRHTHRLDLHGNLRSRALRLLVGGRWRGYPKRRLARWWLIRARQDRFRDRRHVAERYFDAARSLQVAPDGGPPEVFLTQPALRAADAVLRSGGHDETNTLLAFAPGAAHATKRWPIAHWQDLARRLANEEVDLVVVGGPEDRPLGEAIRASLPRAINAAGSATPLETAALLKRARAAVSGDTGLMHLATAVGTPVAALFGPTVEAFGFTPYASRADILQLDLACRPCTAHGGPRCPLGHHRCLVDLTPEAVAAALRKLPR